MTASTRPERVRPSGPRAGLTDRPASSLRMTARARLATEAGPRGAPGGQSRVSTLRSEAPLVLRPGVRREPVPWAGSDPRAARVCLSAGAAGPVGGDDFGLDIRVGAGSTLVLGEISSTLVLPGRDGDRSRMTVRASVEAEATLVWWPQPVIAAHRCDHLNEVQIELAPDARLVMREEVLLGRHGEPPGRLHQHLTVCREGVLIHAQELELGSPTGASPVVAGDYRALGSVLVVAPDPLPDDPQVIGEACVRLPLAAGGVLVSALGHDNLEVRQRLLDGVETLGPQWIPS